MTLLIELRWIENIDQEWMNALRRGRRHDGASKKWATESCVNNTPRDNVAVKSIDHLFHDARREKVAKRNKQRESSLHVMNDNVNVTTLIERANFPRRTSRESLSDMFFLW